VEEEEYLPALQDVHDEAPVEVSMLVILPGAQMTHEVDPEEIE